MVRKKIRIIALRIHDCRKKVQNLSMSEPRNPHVHILKKIEINDIYARVVR
jgi:hypothetical protein